MNKTLFPSYFAQLLGSFVRKNSCQLPVEKMIEAFLKVYFQ